MRRGSGFMSPASVGRVAATVGHELGGRTQYRGLRLLVPGVTGSSAWPDGAALSSGATAFALLTAELAFARWSTAEAKEAPCQRRQG